MFISICNVYYGVYAATSMLNSALKEFNLKKEKISLFRSVKRIILCNAHNKVELKIAHGTEKVNGSPEGVLS